MNSFYSRDEILEFGFKSVGKNVLISKKSSIYKAEDISIGDNVRIDDFCILSGKISIGSYIHISAYASLYAGDAGIDIYDFVAISGKTSIYAISDDYSGEYMTNPMVDEKYRCVYSKKVIIGKHCIIGSSSVILPGITLGEGVAIGACSLITKDCDSWNMYAGIPVKKLRERSKNILNLEQDMMKQL